MIDLSKATVGSAWRRRDGVKVVCVGGDDSSIPFLGDDAIWRSPNGLDCSDQGISMYDIIAPWEETDPQASEPSYEERMRDDIAARLAVDLYLADRDGKLGYYGAIERSFEIADAFMAERKKRTP